MRRISTPGKDDSGSILLDVVVSLVLITITLFPLYASFRNLSKAEQKQQVLLEEILRTLEEQPSWYFPRTADEE